jgi:hypothetical protein
MDATLSAPTSERRIAASTVDAIVLGAILVLAASLRFYAIDHSSLWSDEGNTWALVQRSFGEIARSAAADIHPPGYYWLLKGWSAIFGTSAYSLRSFSAVCGILVVYVTWLIARRVAPTPTSRRMLATTSAFVAAVLPFQIYYSQEARMYMLLALEAAVLFLVMIAWRNAEIASAARRAWMLSAAYALVAAAGLWTHYSFPIVLVAAALAFVVDWARGPSEVRTGTPLVRLAAANLVALLLFAPWMPTALHQITTWPQGSEIVAFGEGLTLTLRTLLWGLIPPPEPETPWLVLAAGLPLLGAIALRRARHDISLVLWLLAPIALMFAFGLFSEPFLKFLLIASAPWCILSAGAAELGGASRPTQSRLLHVSVAFIFALLAALSLPGYYGNAQARDNYRGIAAYLAATANPTTDLVLLNAPGQGDVWSYYDPGIPVLALPAERPTNASKVSSQLDEATRGIQNVYALFWATDESDPDSLVEGWLNARAFKGSETWQRNIRFVRYRLEGQLPCSEFLSEAWPIQMIGVCIPQDRRVVAGEPLPVELQWRSVGPIERDYVVTVQLINQQGQVIAQHDGIPAGGSRPTSGWSQGERIVDRHAIVVPYGTPPGEASLLAAAYDPATGERIPLGGSDQVGLGTISVQSATNSIPVDLLPVEHRSDSRLGAVTLVGYDQFKNGFAHAPDTPLEPGDTLHLTFYWQAPEIRPDDWEDNLVFSLTLGEQTVSAPLAGGSYPTASWLPGEIVRAVVEIPYDGTAQRATLQVGQDTLRLAPVP